MKLLLISMLFFSTMGNAMAANTLEDSFRIDEINGQKAVVEGAPKGLKAGDLLYFNRSPFKFTIESVSGNSITIKLPGSHDLKVGQTLVRNPTEAVLKSIDTEKRLKSALEE